jgi:hypothetical protein
VGAALEVVGVSAADRNEINIRVKNLFTSNLPFEFRKVNLTGEKYWAVLKIQKSRSQIVND